MQPLLSFLPVDTKTVTGRYVLGPLLRSIPVGRERKGQSGDRTRDYPIHAGRSATELPSPSLEESSTPTIPRIYSELIVAALALDSALGGALSSPSQVTKSLRSDLPCQWWDKGRSSNTNQESNCTERTTRTCFIAVGTITGRNSLRSVLIMELVSV